MKKGGGINVHPATLDSFARDTIFPSEDFEIVYAAICVNTHIFLTNDKHLRKCAMSLGQNYPLHGTDFCSTEDYAHKIDEWLALRDLKENAKNIRETFAKYAEQESQQ